MFRAILALLLTGILPGFAAAAEMPTKTATAVATFAAGCYWCVESDFDKVKGVLETTPGFMGGQTENPTYQQVSTGKTGHAEVVRVTYDPAIVTYRQLLDQYWANVDPLDAGGQFCDRGSQYRPAIFYYDEQQKAQADASKAAIEGSKRFEQPLVVEVAPASAFTPAPDPDFYLNNPIRYKFYRAGCGRDARLKQVWGDGSGH